MAQAQAEAAQPTELKSSGDDQSGFLEIPPIENNSFRSETSLALAQTDNTNAFRAMTGGEQTDVQKATSTIVNGIWSTTDNSETIFNTLRDLKDKGKLNELIESFDNTYMVGLRTQLAVRFPNSGDRISEIIDNKPPVFSGLNQEQLKKVFDRFPELKGAISSPDVLGAMVENEVDHTVGLDDMLIDGALSLRSSIRRSLGYDDGTQYFSTLNPDAFKEKAEKSSGLSHYFNKFSGMFQDRILKVSVGEGQVQIRNILALQDQERAAGREIPSLTMSLTTEGSAQLIAAYLTKSIELLKNNQISDPSKNPFLDASRPSVVKGFEEAQRLWDTKDPASMERAVMMTYNPGVKDSMTGEHWGPSRILKYYLGRK